MKKPSNGWGRIRGHGAPKPDPAHHGRGGEETARRSAGAVSSPRARGAQSQLPPTNREGKTLPYPAQQNRATGESPPASQAAHSQQHA